MQHNKKIKIRVIHQNLHRIGSMMLFLGLLFMFGNKFLENKSMFPQTPHAILGWLALLAITGQAFAGTQKLQTIDIKGGQRPFRWHGDAGLVLWDILCLTLLLGMLEFFEFRLINFIAEVSIFVVWWIVHLQMKTKRREDNESNEEMQNMLPAETDEQPSSSGVSGVASPRHIV